MNTPDMFLTAEQQIRLEIVRVLLTAPGVEIDEADAPEGFGAEVVRVATPIAAFIIGGLSAEPAPNPTPDGAAAAEHDSAECDSDCCP